MHKNQMKILQQIKINNFLSHKETTIDFKPNTKILIDGPSGHGKSGIVEAILWNLYGKGRVDNRYLIRKGSTAATVTLILAEDNDPENSYKITRQITDKGKHTLEAFKHVPGGKFTPVEINGIREVQEWIEKTLIGASYQLFTNSVAYTQDNVDNFIKQTPTKRKELLMEMLNIEDFSGVYEKAKTALSKYSSEKDTCTALKFSKIEQLNKLNKDINDSSNVNPTIESLELHRSFLSGMEKAVEFEEDSIRINKIVIDKSNSKISTLTGIVNRDRDSIIKIDKELASLEIPDPQKIEKMLFEISQKPIYVNELDRLETSINGEHEKLLKYHSLIASEPRIVKIKDSIDNINRQMIPLIKETRRCPSGDNCPFSLPIAAQIQFFSESLKEKETDLSNALIERDEWETELNNICLAGIPSIEKIHALKVLRSTQKSSISNIEEYEKYISTSSTYTSMVAIKNSELLSIKNRIAESEKEIDNENKLINDVNTNLIKPHEATLKEICPMGIQKLKMDIEECKAKIVRAKTQLEFVNGWVQQVTSVTSEVADLDSKIEILNKDIKIMEATKDAFGNKGIKTVAIDYLIPRLEAQVNDILKKVSDFSIEFETQMPNIDNSSIIEGLFINIRNDRGELMDHSSYSGGERLKLVVAISEALASLQKVGFRIIDELFVGLDETSVDGFSRVMNKLMEGFSQVLCISHITSIKEAFTDTIIVKKTNGITQIT